MQAGLLGAVLFGAGAIAADTADTADHPENPYQGIVDRNVFALKPPPPPPDPDSIKPPTPEFFLTGITTIFGPKRALFRTSPKPARGAPPPGKDKEKEESYMLAEGQREGEVEVVSIDEVAGMVKVSYGGTILTIDFTNNAAKSVAVAPPPGGVPGAPGLPRPGIAIPAPNKANPGFRQPGAPARPLRSPLGQGGVPAPMGAGMGVAQTGTGQTAEQAVPLMTRDQQEVLMEAMRGQPGLPPMPPTSFTLNPAEGVAPGAPARGLAPPGLPGPPVPGRLY